MFFVTVKTDTSLTGSSFLDSPPSRGMTAFMFLLLTTAFLFNCSYPVDTAGGAGSETTNTISGTLMRESDTPAADVKVFLRSPGYSKSPVLTKRGVDSTFTMVTATDRKGKFMFELEDADTGAMVLEAIADPLHAIKIAFEKPEGEAVKLGERIMKPVGGVSGMVTLPVGDQGNALVQVMGTPRYVQLENGSLSFSISGLPAGSYTVRASGYNPDRTAIETIVEVEPGRMATGVEMELGESDPPWLRPGWDLTFQDEFGGTGVDLNKWEPRDIFESTRNQELQAYLEEAVGVGDGMAVLSCEKRQVAYGGVTKEYVSGMINSHGNFAQQFGRFEIRCRNAAGQGYRSSFWMMQEGDSAVWPPELVIMNRNGDNDTRLDVNIQWLQDTVIQKDYYGYDTTGLSDGFHIYACEWEADVIRWYVDGIMFYEYRGEGIPQAPMFMMVNLSIGGRFGGDPGPDTPFPGVFEVDYVRVYKHE